MGDPPARPTWNLFRRIVTNRAGGLKTSFPHQVHGGQPGSRMRSAGNVRPGTNLATHSLTLRIPREPIGIQETKPRLSWWCESGARGAVQTAYQILVASSEERLKKNEGDLWNTGKVASDESTQIEYSGELLRIVQSAWWKVRVWDGQGKASSYSVPAMWELGLSKNSDWDADWIGMPKPKEKDITLHGRNWICGFPKGNPAPMHPRAPRYFPIFSNSPNLRRDQERQPLDIVDDEATVYLNGKRLATSMALRTITVIASQ